MDQESRKYLLLIRLLWKQLKEKGMSSEEKEKLYELKYFIDKLARSHIGDWNAEASFAGEDLRILLPEKGIIPRTIFLSPGVEHDGPISVAERSESRLGFTDYLLGSTPVPFGRISNPSVSSNSSSQAALGNGIIF